MALFKQGNDNHGIRSSSVEISFCEVGPSMIHKRGLFAARDLAVGETVLVESPLVVQQDLDNKQEVLACGWCMGFVDGGAELIGPLGQGKTTRQAVFEKLAADPRVCSCGEMYCCTSCKTRHAASGHEALCCGPLTEDQMDHALIRFKLLAVQSNEIFLLAAEALARCLAESSYGQSFSDNDVDEDDGDAAVALFESRFGAFTGLPWPDVILNAHELQDKKDKAEDKEIRALRKKLVELCGDAAALLVEALSPRFPNGAKKLITAERISCLIGTFEQNNIGVRAFAPVLPPVPPTPFAFFDPGDGIQPPLQGTALYSVACCANHSCSPTLDVIYQQEPSYAEALKVRLVTIRPVAKGEELTICYVDTTRSRSRRRKETTNYGFICNCPRCDKAESEDYDDDEDDDGDECADYSGEDEEAETDDEDLRDRVTRPKTPSELREEQMNDEGRDLDRAYREERASYP